MNTLRNIFSSRALNYFRQNAQNALINVTQSVENNATTGTPIQPLNGGNGATTTTALNNRCINQPLIIPKTILDVTKFTCKELGAEPKAKPQDVDSTSTTTLKHYRRMGRKVKLVYRCKLCNTRNSKLISEAAYNSGIVILQCDGCAVDHLIKDNLGWFANTKGKNFDEILAEKSINAKVIKVNERGELI